MYSEWEEKRRNEPIIVSKTFSRGRRYNNSRNDHMGNRGNQQRTQEGGSGTYGNWRSPQGNEATTFTIDSSKVGKVIGRGGCKIRELEEQTGTSIKVTKCDDDYNTQNVVITGSDESRNRCKELIEELISDRPPPRHQDGESQQGSQPVRSDILTSNGLIDWGKLNKECDQAQAEIWAKCPPLKKDFYFEDPEVACIPEDVIQEIRKEKNNIVVKNVFENLPIPNPVLTFEQAFKDYPDILREIKKQGFQFPSPIQCQGWPILLKGRDLIGIAQTGTGKTLAFLLPALIHIDGQEIPREQRGGANVLIIAPTRELALQIENEVKKYSYRNIKSVCVYGGGNRKEQMNVVTSGVEIIIATPGRLNDLVEAGIINVSAVTYLVLDEADRMLDLGFEPQIRKVLLDIRPDRQNIMTSATWPEGVRRLAEKYMNNPVQVFVGSLDLAAVHSVTQTVLLVDETEKQSHLHDFIGSLSEEDKVMIFVGRKSEADNISSDLALEGIICDCIHGDRAQCDRERALEDLKTGAVRILIATDVASRGIDIADVTKVFNYDFPRNIEEYVHRVGRTGRAGKTGEAISLFTRGDWAYAGDLIKIMEEANQTIPEELYSMRERFEKKKMERDSDRGSRGGRGRGGFDRRGGFERSRNRW